MERMEIRKMVYTYDVYKILENAINECINKNIYNEWEELINSQYEQENLNDNSFVAVFDEIESGKIVTSKFKITVSRLD
jgi:hypothetical protein